MAPQPISEAALLSGPLEPTNQWYAIAKIAGLMQCQAYREQHGCDFISAMPTNLYGPGDNFDLKSAHVLPAFLHRFRAAALAGDAKVTVWGTGTPRREFLHVDDCADALVFLLRHYSDASTINVGVGRDVTIAELASLVAGVVPVQGPDRLRHLAPRRHPAQAARCQPADRARLAGTYRAQGRHHIHLPMAGPATHRRPPATRLFREGRVRGVVRPPEIGIIRSS
jgi:nucleoside-diphosphate-sugar epimerase